MKIMTITVIIIKDKSKHITSVEDSTYLVLVKLLVYKAILKSDIHANWRKQHTYIGMSHLLPYYVVHDWFMHVC